MDGSLMDPMVSFDPKADGRGFRDALGRFATGITVITTHDAEFGRVGITANSFASVSLDPPLVLWSPAKSSSRFDVFSKAERFIIHVLRDDQRDVANAFVKDWSAFGSDGWEDTSEGIPRLTSCLAAFDCTLAATHEAGDHVIVIGEVTRAHIGDGAPLIFSAGAYGGFTRG